MVVFDFPYGAMRRYLITGARMPAGLRADLTRAVTAVLDQPDP